MSKWMGQKLQMSLIIGSECNGNPTPTSQWLQSCFLTWDSLWLLWCIILSSLNIWITFLCSNVVLFVLHTWIVNTCGFQSLCVCVIVSSVMQNSWFSTWRLQNSCPLPYTQPWIELNRANSTHLLQLNKVWAISFCEGEGLIMSNVYIS